MARYNRYISLDLETVTIRSMSDVLYSVYIQDEGEEGGIHDRGTYESLSSYNKLTIPRDLIPTLYDRLDFESNYADGTYERAASTLMENIKKCPVPHQEEYH